MAYIGRVAGVGATNEGNPVLLYGLSGRSPSSVSRMAVVHGGRVSIEPYGVMTLEQKAEASRLVYDAIHTTRQWTPRGFVHFGIVSNGRQTGSIHRDYTEAIREGSFLSPPQNIISTALMRWGHEGKVGDRYDTPRIAGMINVGSATAALGIITAENENRSQLHIARGFRNLTRGSMIYLSTYTGESAEPEAPKFEAVSEAVKTRRIEGRTARELAEEMYAFMDPEFVVASAAALWVPQNEIWKLAAKNKN
ncbi:MAG: hypothetical protein HY051_01945 [Candidatus Aenigmarchaeota archaeon]|nr:hypothetical protein [Candidatus Aenigmarchaeota archaeon]